MIDHISLRVQDLSRALDFYKAALAPLGYKVLMEFPGVAGLGADGKADLWVMETDQPINPTHIALNGQRAHVHAFHEAALAAGGTDNGPPGLRADYHPHYYAAFILDGDGNNVEVVCHNPEGASGAESSRASPSKSRRAPASKRATAVRAAASPTKARAKKSVKKAAAKANPAKSKPARQSSKNSGKKAGKTAGGKAGKKRR